MWSWFSQFVLPALTLLAGAFTVSASPNDQRPVENPLVFWAAVALSVVYVALIYLVVANQAASAQPWNEQLKESALFLGVIQALVIGVLGKFFIESSR